MLPLTNGHKLYNMIKEPTCFKSAEGRSIDLLTNIKHSFQHTQAFETGASDHHLMIYTMFKTTFKKLRCYMKFSQKAFSKDLAEKVYSSRSGDYSAFEDAFIKILDKHAPR